MAKYWTSSKKWTTTINSSTRYLVGSSGGRCNYQTIGAGSTKRILQSNGSNGNIKYANLTIPVPSGNKTFTSSQTWTVPAGVTRVTVFCVGGGASGSSNSSTRIGGGGGGGGYTKTATVNVTPGQKISVTVGSGGAVPSDDYIRNAGGSSSLGSLCSASGGSSANGGANGGPGGSGGGAGCQSGADSQASGTWGQGGDGGSDGGNGEGTRTASGARNSGGAGQGTTTRAYGQSSGTLYAGGGGGTARNTYGGGDGGSGGGGDGGNSTDSYNGEIWGSNVGGSNGTANTGGGGGGSLWCSNGRYPGAGGSGIVLIKWG